MKTSLSSSLCGSILASSLLMSGAVGPAILPKGIKRPPSPIERSLRQLSKNQRRKLVVRQRIKAERRRKTAEAVHP